jgi:hypothetical protein
MDRFVNRENIKRYRKLASERTDAAERSLIMKLLAAEEARFKVELKGRDGGLAERSSGKGAAAKPTERDREEQQGGG